MAIKVYVLLGYALNFEYFLLNPKIQTQQYYVFSIPKNNNIISTMIYYFNLKICVARIVINKQS